MIKPLKDYIFDTLSTVHENVDSGTTRPQGDSYPCITFSFPTSNPEDNDRDDFILEINIWDNKSDSEKADEITDNIEAKFKKARHLDYKQFLMFQKLNRLEIPDTEEYVRRRMLRYLIKREER